MAEFILSGTVLVGTPPRAALTPRQIAAYNHAAFHPLDRKIDECRRCKRIIRRCERRAT